MSQQPEIKLSPLIADDAPALFAWINDRDQVLFNAPYKPVSEPQHAEWLAAVVSRRDAVIFAIRTVSGNTLIGTCQLHSINPVHRSAELQIRIGAEEARGKGYGKNAVRLLLRFAFVDLNLHRVMVHVFADNDRAIRLYESTGFRREGTLRDAAFINGRYVDVIVMGILETERNG
jgi:RimJ/RimL family protein N-acetyltransferase